MPFYSFRFFLFLPLVYLAYRLAGDRQRWAVLLAASLIFYAAAGAPHLPAVLLSAAALTYGFGLWLERARSEAARRAIFIVGAAANVAILVGMKYLPFILENLSTLLAPAWPSLSPGMVKGVASIGVSYYIFQAISYLFDIYLGVVKAERHFGYFLLYLSFFPKLLQGPIERAEHLLPQLRVKYEFNYENMRSGLLLFACGFVKKLLIADRLGLYVDRVYGDVHAYAGLPLAAATYIYSFQIYLDFSGYTDMALGCALIFNIGLTQNFNSPYLAVSVSDFWRRWHISFSRWILDYIFKPLQLQWRDLRNIGTAAALIVTFLVSGIWHGASWGFIVWGALHGLYMACSIFYKPLQKRLYGRLGIAPGGFLKAWQIFVTFNLVSFAWIFFRANSLSDAAYIISSLVPGSFYESALQAAGLLFGGKENLVNAALAAAALGLLAPLRDMPALFSRPAWLRRLYYAVLAAAALLFQADGSANFLYLRF